MNDLKMVRLLRGKTIVSREPGNSMMPIIRSRQSVVLEPISWTDVEIGDIVYCKVRGNFYTHKVVGKNDKRDCLIANNRGRINGWTKKVFGRVTEVLPQNWKKDEDYKKTRVSDNWAQLDSDSDE